ncbi:PD-(D/E)XK nuclease-like domain-containing protein [Hymenobacter yonginensis]|uniref:PD-(D/E)XK nuclease-like domain-containing protein n=1 Tax=Hymenobacter yonginensis TaxID=748197 RepID=A0ABY7PR02_9BACT|nr:PD-(D/E)XK nuclease-like domain-containing protein [Hymenobacter yonginensis]WBO85238.1 PD-(D/E)XK nuclease-like domain-containing protein [Hymenobacter yonginensis]
MKLPAIQFYPGDWHKDQGVQALDLAQRGAWFKLLLMMHDSDERGVHWADLEMLACQVRRQRYCRDLLYRGTPELTHTAVHIETGIAVKVRPDLLVRSRAGRRLTLIDFKTTSCPDRARFLATIEQYDYDRQAAFYCDVLQADRFLIIGVQKKAPHELWVVEVSADAALMEQGRKKYQRLLRAYAQQDQGLAVKSPTPVATPARLVPVTTMLAYSP